MWWSPLPKMGLWGFIIVLQIIRVHSVSGIVLENDDEHLKTAADNIMDQCFGSSERWSELLIVSDQDSCEILEKIHHRSKTSNLVVFLNPEKNDNGLTHPRKYNSSFNANFEWEGSKATAIIITTHSVEHLEYVLRFLKNSTPSLWRPGSYILIVLDTRCDVAELNNMFKVIWDYWILNAVILSSSNEPGNRNRSDIALYNFNPYSGDHPQQWETIVHETVEVTISQGKFNHSWHIFKQTFAEIKSSDDCGDIFFDKTSNLDGYVIPVSVDRFRLLSSKSRTTIDKWLTSELGILRSIAKSLQFKFVEVLNDELDKYGQQGFVNGSYTGMKNDMYHVRSHLGVIGLRAMPHPGLGMIYPHDRVGVCLASRIVGNRPQWTNFAVAKQIWIGLGLSLLFSTIFLYLHNKSQGIVSALLNAERLLIGSSLVNTSAGIKNRTILGSMFLVILVIDGAIKGRFISILTVVRPYPNIETLDQVKDRDLDIYGPETYAIAITDPLPEARYHRNTTLGPCIRAIERGEGDTACATDCRYLSYLTVNSSIVHKSSTPIWTSPVAYITAQHWPMKNRYSFELRKLLESGIFQKWKSDPARDAEVEGWEQSRILEPPSVRPTKLNDLLPAFLLLAVGLSIALMIFACEMKRLKYLRWIEC